jgi:transcriptional regulator with XRE-family HTH domain
VRQSKTLQRAKRDLGLRVRELRRATGKTQEETAEGLDMHPQNYARIEQGRMNATLETAVRLAGFFRVELHGLFRPPKPQIVRPGRPRKSEG